MGSGETGRQPVQQYGKEYMRLKDLAKKAKYSPSVMMDKVETECGICLAAKAR